MLRRAIACFLAQDYVEKELVVVYESDDPATALLLAAEAAGANGNIHPVRIEATPRRTLGELRNIGIGVACGAYVCQWDDDDWYHAGRLSAQLRAAADNGCSGSILSRWVVFDTIRKQAYLSNTRLWEGSILCRKDILQSMPYEDKSIGEDTHTVERLASRDELYPMPDAPGLYIYIYHGDNTWNFEHWRYIFACSRELPPEDSMAIAAIVDGHYSPDTGSLLLEKILEKPSLIK